MARNSPKPPQTKPNHPEAFPPRAAVFWSHISGVKGPKIDYYGVSMSTFARQLRMIGGPVVDRTGLTGKYNFSLTWLSLDPDEREGSVSFDDPYPLSHWNFAALGLRIERIQIPTEHIVIDHIEKPSPN